MKKALMIVAAGLFITTGLKAQTIQEGVNHLYADRFKSAVGVFEKLLAANPNNIEATYWLGQTYLDMDVNDKARDLYDKALTTSANAPLLLVGRGHVDLLDGKTAEARQKFETAVTMTKGRKGNDPVILNAVGRANVDAKKGDLPYAIQVLEEAALRDDKNPDIFLNLGNAHRKAKPGEGGGAAFQNYKKALDVNPNFAIAYVRLAALFETQRNGELWLENLNKAVSVDPKFSPAYYDLFYYYFYRAKLDEAETQLKGYIAARQPDTYIEDQYLYAQLCWARKDFNCAITKAEAVNAAMGDEVKVKGLKLLADAYNSKGDSVNAKKYIDQFFAKAKPEQLDGYAYSLKAAIYFKFPGNEDQVIASIMEGVRIDTVVDNKVNILKEWADRFKLKGQREREGDMLVKLTEIKPKPSINDYFDAGRAYYFGQAYTKSWNQFNEFVKKYPDEVYGWEWRLNNAKIIDSVKKDSIAVPAALELITFTQKDTAKYAKQYSAAAFYMASFYASKNDREKAVEYLKMMKAVERDPAKQESIQNNIEALSRPAAPRQNAPRSGGATSAPAKTNSTGGKSPAPASKPK